MLTALNTWKRNAVNMWWDIAVIEAYLLFIVLLHRDLELPDFDFDVDTPLASRPDYFEQLSLRLKYFSMITATLSKIAKSIPTKFMIRKLMLLLSMKLYKIYNLTSIFDSRWIK